MSNETEVFQDELNAEVSLAVQTKLADANITETHLANLKAELLPLAAEPITDDAKAALVKGALRKVSNTKGIIERICKVGRRPALLAQRAWIAAENELTAVTEEIQKPLKARMDEWEAIAAAKAAEEVARWTAKITIRKQRLGVVGFRFNPLTQEYELPGFASINEEGVIGLNVDDLQFAEWLLDLEKQVTEHKERQEEEERTRRIAADALAAEQRAKEAAQKAEADRIAAAQAELERKQKEMEAKEAQMNARVNEARKNELIAAGMTLDDPDDELPFGPSLVLVDMCLPVHELCRMTDEQYAEAIAEAKRQAAELAEYNRQREEEERVQREQQEKERIAREEAMKAEAAERAVAEERERIERERKAEEEEKARAAYKEAERIASLGDKGKMEELSATLASIYLPNPHSAMGQHGIARVRKHLDELIKMVESIAKDL